jgi:hypothetical protein
MLKRLNLALFVPDPVHFLPDKLRQSSAADLAGSSFQPR